MARRDEVLPRGVWRMPYRGANGERYAVAIDHAGRCVFYARILPGERKRDVLAMLRRFLDREDPPDGNIPAERAGADVGVEVDAALDRLASGADLPCEPNKRDVLSMRLGAPHARAFNRQCVQISRIRAKVNRELCERIPVACRRCGREFRRERIQQVHCRPCIDLRRG